MKANSSLVAESSHTPFSQRLVLSLACTSLVTGGISLMAPAPGVAQTSPTSEAQLTQSQSRRVGRMPTEIARQVLQDAAQRSQVPVNQLRIVQVTEQTFGNACDFNFGDVCNFMYEPIPGWEAVVNVKGQPWRYHVSRSGNRIVLDPKTAIEVPTSIMPGAHIDAVIMDASRRANVSPASIRISQSKQVNFGNPCLFHFGVYCTKEYNPIDGFEVLAQVNGQTWTYHVDRPAKRVVLDPRVATSTTSTMPVALQSRILSDAATRSGLPASSLQVTQVSQRSFSNACVFNFGEMCPMIYQPVEGWEAMVKVRDQSWTYRIDRTGNQMAVDPRITNTGRLPAPVENAVLQNARTWTTSPTVQIVSAKAQTWGNECAFNFGRICPANFQPIEGWAVKVNTGGLEWTYHTNKTGNQVVMDRRAVLPTQVANAITRDIAKRSGPSVPANSLRFLEVKEQSKRVCFFLRGCRDEATYLTVVSNGRQQWGYESDDQGRQVVPVAVSKVLQATDNAVSQR